MRQLLHVAMEQHIFREAPGRPGVVTHTPALRVLVEDDLLYQWVAWYTGNYISKVGGAQNVSAAAKIPPLAPLSTLVSFQFHQEDYTRSDSYLPEGEDWAASYRAVDAMSKWPGSGEPDQTGFALAHGKAMYEYLSEHPNIL